MMSCIEQLDKKTIFCSNLLCDTPTRTTHGCSKPDPDQNDNVVQGYAKAYSPSAQPR